MYCFLNVIEIHTYIKNQRDLLLLQKLFKLQKYKIYIYMRKITFLKMHFYIFVPKYNILNVRILTGL